MNEKVRQSAITSVYDKLHENKLGAHWLWCVIEKIAAGESEEEAMRDFGYYSRAALAAQPGAVPDSRPLRDYLKERIANMTPEQLAAFESARARIQESLAAAPTEAKPAQQDAVDAEQIKSGLNRAFSMGQNYWANADSESYKANNLADAIRQKFIEMRDGLCAAISAKKGQP